MIPIHSGGTAGLIGYLLYWISDGTPRLVEARGGFYRAGFKPGLIAQDEIGLIIEQPVYAAGEPNCCPSRSTFTQYQVAETGLIQMGEPTFDESL